MSKQLPGDLVLLRESLKEQMHLEGNTKTFVHCGLPVVILRHYELMHLNGYVFVPPDHVLHNVDLEENEMLYSIHPHGGVTWTGPISKLMEMAMYESREALRPFVNEYWGYRGFGFDTAHHMDLQPAFLFRDDLNPELIAGEVYRTMRYVVNEAKALAEKLHEFKSK